MISKVLMQILLGGGGGGSGGGDEADVVVMESDSCAELLECEDGDWIIINTPELVVEDPLENLLIEHPSMSVYQMRHQMNEEDASDEEEDSHRCVQVRRDVSHLLALWCGSVLFSDHRARGFSERRKLSRSAICRQNLIRTRVSNTERRYGHFKQPAQRLH